MRASNCIGECNDSKINNDHCDNENIRCKDDLESLSNMNSTAVVLEAVKMETKSCLTT